MKKYIIPIAIVLLTGTMLGSCKDKDLTTDPNNPKDADAYVMMSGIEAADVFIHEGELARKSGLWIRCFTGGDRQYIPYHSYDVTSGDFDNEWGAIYSSTLKQARLLQEKARELNKLDMVGVAEVIEAHAAGTAADLWGDVPFSEAGDVDKFPTPNYDKQADVYAAVQKKLDSAIVHMAGIKANAYTLTTSAPDWIAIAHSLKARYYVHTGDWTNAMMHANMGINSTAKNWMALHPGSDKYNYNLYYQFIDFDRGGYMTASDAIAYQMLNSTSASYRGNAKTDESGRKGFYYLDTPENPCEYTYGSIDPNFCDGIFAYDASFALITYQEMELILAEGYARQGADSAAVAHLNKVRAAHAAKYSKTYADYAVADFEAGGMAAMAGMTTNASILYEILEEKYLTLFGQIEAFTDLRRKGNIFRSTITPTKITSTGSFPERFLYPQSEINSNPKVPSPLPGLFDKTPVNQ